MRKKHMLTTTLVMITSFFITTVAADVLDNNEEIPKTHSKEVNASTMKENAELNFYERNGILDVAEDDELLVMKVLEEQVAFYDDEFVLSTFSLANQLIDTQSEDVNEDLGNHDAGINSSMKVLLDDNEEAVNSNDNEDINNSLLLDSHEDNNSENTNAIVQDNVNFSNNDTLISNDLIPTKAPVVFDKIIAKVSESLNVRSEASTDSKIVGRLLKDNYGVILERFDNWTKIKSGDLVGYVSNDYIYQDEAAVEYAKSLGTLIVEVNAGSVNIRSMPTTESEILGKATSGNTYASLYQESTDEWYAISYEGATAYINKELSILKLNLKTGRTIEEIEKQEKAEALAKELESAKNVQTGKTTRSAIKASNEEIFLMATVIASEALSESYEGKMAVANVIINRLISGKWGNTIHSVIYAKGQFSGSNTGRFEKYEKLVNEDCKKAAIEALAGVNNIDNFLFFISKGKAKYSNYSKYYVLGGHVFYMR